MLPYLGFQKGSKHKLLGGVSLPHCFVYKGAYGISQPSGSLFGYFFGVPNINLTNQLDSYSLSPKQSQCPTKFCDFGTYLKDLNATTFRETQNLR